MKIQICGKAEIAARSLCWLLHYVALELPQASVQVCPSRGDHSPQSWQPSLRETADRLGVPIVNLYESADDPNLVLFSLEYDRIIRVDRFASSSLYNVHFSLLPKYRGVYTSILPILFGETETGVTVHLIDQGIDTGDIVAQRRIPLPEGMTARDLYRLYNLAGFQLFRESAPHILRGDSTKTPQEERLASSFTRSSLEIGQEAKLNLAASADDIERRVRAFFFPEYQTASLNGRPVVACHRVAHAADHSPGTCLTDNGISGVFVSGDGEAIELVWG